MDLKGITPLEKDSSKDLSEITHSQLLPSAEIDMGKYS